MKKLLSIVRGRMQENVMDITMKFTLSALWNLTDESPRTCKVSDLLVDPVKRRPYSSRCSWTKKAWSCSWMSSIHSLESQLSRPKY